MGLRYWKERTMTIRIYSEGKYSDLKAQKKKTQHKINELRRSVLEGLAGLKNKIYYLTYMEGE